MVQAIPLLLKQMRLLQTMRDCIGLDVDNISDLIQIYKPAFDDLNYQLRNLLDCFHEYENNVKQIEDKFINFTDY